uniref:G-protein coupled receptors family 1 profile domain-containing protein n=1 Tax=Plectus sambesii TaxID=2011161 RepID=A0A914VC55_9BILA
MANDSFVNATASPVTNYYSDMHKFWIYVFQGAFLLIANALIVGAIAFHEPLRRRKEYILIAGLSLADGANGFGLFTAGLFRNLMILDGTAGTLVSRLQCILTPWNLCFVWTDALCHVMLLTVSIDRFIAVKFPLKYYTFSTRYAYGIVGGTYLFIFINLAMGIGTTLKHNYPEKPKLCYTAYALSDFYYAYHTWLAVAGDMLSVLLYIIVIYISYKTTHQMDHQRVGTTRISAQQLKALQIQKKVTRTLGISSLCTFLFYCIPYAFKMLVQPYVTGNLVNSVIPYTFIVNQLNQMANFFIYTSRQRDLRIGLKNFIMCKKVSEAKFLQAAFAADSSGAVQPQFSSYRSRNNSLHSVRK